MGGSEQMRRGDFKRYKRHLLLLLLLLRCHRHKRRRRVHLLHAMVRLLLLRLLLHAVGKLCVAIRHRCRRRGRGVS